MAKIPLRTYGKNIESFIERGEIDQATVHAKHILQNFPKHIDTYRLLGKAYLENQLYAEAADILQRVLSVFPDDFISQIGMSIIREDEANLDAAIWHMERAYEVQPFNPAVQDELRRLYGRRDGVEPPKIRLTRGALVRMYARGDLYPQAIAETRAALAEDPSRYDLQVLLARLYLQNGQKIEATEACSAIISKLPYCYEANRILTEILPGTSRADDVKIFQQRLVALNPYEAFVSTTAPTSDLVPDQAILLDEFSYAGMEAASASDAPDWTRSAGVEWKEEPREDLPNWLNNLSPQKPAAEPPVSAPPAAAPEPAATAAAGPLDQAPGASEPTAEGDDLIPDWMKSAGWAPSTGAAEETPTAFDFSEDAQAGGEAAPAEIPDWLQSIAPQQGAEAGAAEQEKTDWLSSILPGQGAAETRGNTPDQEPAAVEPEVPAAKGTDEEWLATLGGAAASAVPAEESLSIESDAAEAEMPDWMSEIAKPSEEPAAPAETPGWMAEIAPAAEEPAAESQAPDWMSTITGQADEPAAQADIPDWMSALQPSEEPQAEQSDLPDWMSELAPKSEESPADTAAPDWLSALTNPHAEQPPADQPTPAETPEWMQTLAAQVDTPDWLKAVETGAAAAAAPVDEAALETAQPLEQPTGAPSGEMPGMENMDDAMAWLESLAAKQGADEATLSTPPELRTDVPPDWVQAQAMEAEAAPQAEAATEAEASSDAISAPEIAANGMTAPVDESVPTFVFPTTSETVPTASAEVSEFLAASEAAAAEEESVEPTQPVSIKPAAAVEATTQVRETAAVEPGMENLDDAMAWLESLAAKQGADEATLSTPPELRTDTPPDWLARQVEAPGEAVDAPMETPQALAGDSAPAGPGDLAEEEKEAAPAELPDWLQEIGTGEPELPAAQAEQPVSTEPLSWLTDVEEPAAQPLIEVPEVQAGAVAEASAEAPAEAAPDLNTMNMDDAMAWLESLAAKQGAEEATLSTPPDQRTETPPDWVQAQIDAQPAGDQAAEPAFPAADVSRGVGIDPAAEAEPQEAEPADLPDWMAMIGAGASEPAVSEQPSGQPAPKAEAQAMPPVEDMDATMAWLESLAAKQGADKATLSTSPDQRTDLPPEWVRQEIEAQAAEPEAAAEFPSVAETPAQEMPAGITFPEVPGASAPEAAAEGSFEEDFSWLETLAARQGAEEGTLITRPEDRVEETPEWLAKAEDVQAAETVGKEASAAQDIPAEVVQAEPEPEVPQPVADETGWQTEPQADAQGPDQGAPAWAEEQPGNEADSMAEWLRGLDSHVEPADADQFVEPVSAVSDSQWLPAEEAGASGEAHPAPAQVSTLAEAQTALMRGNLEAALDCYNGFIQRGEKLDEVIHDLRDALYRYPVDISLWQVLGDAFARNNQLQEALDAYTKAEELLR